MKLPKFAQIIEVGPRDGLQSQKHPLTLDQKASWIKTLINSGLKRIEFGSFVSPKAVPAMADSFELISQLPKSDEVDYIALVPNEKGMAKAIEAQVDEVAVFTAASDEFCRHNINATVEESFARFEPVVKQAQTSQIPVRGYVSTVFSCPYSGLITPAQVWPVIDRLFEMGCHEVSLGDTLGTANPLQVRQLLSEVATRYKIEHIAIHFHDTWSRALTNCWEALELGFTKFDASAGGLGGCPYAPGASGNVATDDLDALFKQLDVQTGIDSQKLQQSTALLQSFVPTDLPSKVFKAQNH